MSQSVPNVAYRTAKKNALVRGIAFTLSSADFAAIVARSGGRCELTGIAFDHTASGRKWARRPWAASLDRIDSATAYTADNCRLVCVAVNLALSTFGEAALIAVARGILGFKDAQAYADFLKTTTPGVRVSICRHSSPRFNARINIGGKHKNLGTFDTLEEASRAFANARFASRMPVGN